MHLIVCLGARDGMSFCGRRLSRDRAVSEHILRLTAGKTLWCAPESAMLFPEGTVSISPDFQEKAGRGEYCFLETGPWPSAAEMESITVYNWNRTYPYSVKFPKEILRTMQPVTIEEFAGFSHEKITMTRFAP